MSEQYFIDDSRLSLIHALKPPASLDEGLARTFIWTSRILGNFWECQRIVENQFLLANANLFATCDQVWKKSLETAYLREPRASERISIS
jgi:hypothetical protein